MNSVNRFAIFKGFATEYYTVIKASRLGGISIGYVRFRENKFYQEVDEKQELEDIKKLIKGQTAELAKTDLLYVLINAVKSERNVSRIAKFYDSNDVQIVRDLMMEGILSRNQ